MKLILLLKVIPLDFDATVTTFHKFFNSVRKCLLVTSLMSFAARQFLERIVTTVET
jgi:hypothetical protein